MKRYPKYTDSGVEWIGQVPKEWDVSAIRRFCQVKRGASPRPIDDQKYFDDNGEFAWVRIADVSSSSKYLYQTTQTLSELGSSLSVKKYPDELFLSIAGTVGKPIISKIKCCIHDGFVYFENLSLYHEFLYYIFFSGRPYLGLGKWGTQLNLNTDTIADIKIPVPPYNDQVLIASFLDYKTQQIDDLITKKQKLIEQLKKERTTIINQAVTKGLDSTVPLKDSGIEWLREIPEHWMQKRLKFIVDNIIEKSNTSDFKIALENIESWTGRYIKTESPSELTGEMKSFKPNDILFNKLRPYLAKVYLPKVEGECVGELLVLRSKKFISPKFLYYRLLSRDFIEVVNSSTYGAKMPRASWEDFIRNLIIPYPEIDEQNKIVISIEKMNMSIADTIAKLELEIELISEYKISLINEAVTGKIDVRDYQINHA